VYDFSTHTRSAQTVAVLPKRAVILEGILVLADPDLRRLMDIEPSKRHAHVIIPEGGQNSVGVDMLITKVRAIARTA
jgi:uridine kinase